MKGGRGKLRGRTRGSIPADGQGEEGEPVSEKHSSNLTNASGKGLEGGGNVRITRGRQHERWGFERCSTCPGLGREQKKKKGLKKNWRETIDGKFKKR